MALAVAALGLLTAASASAHQPASPPPPVYGTAATEKAFNVWLSTWRNFYAHTDASAVPHLPDDALPKGLRGVTPTVVASDGGAAGGVVSEGMGYALMVEGIMATQGDTWAMDLAKALTRSWLGMVQGSDDPDDPPLGGADDNDGTASTANTRPYGISAIAGLGPAGVSTWKFPRKECMGLSNLSDPCHGSATDGDEDAVFGMIYLAAALDYPDDFVDLVVREVVAFASSDLGFPDLYRTLPDGQKVFVPKAGSQWGGVTPPHGKFKREAHVPSWCYVPAYFAPAHYRTFRDFAKRHWKPHFDKYLPPHVDGRASTLEDLVEAFDGAVLAGYNILYYSSCESGSVSNWVGVASPCPHADDLNCAGVPWAYTPYVGPNKGNCSASGTPWGSFGSDASRAPWRLAMDYILFTKEAESVRMYDRAGKADKKIEFNARKYLNRIVTQYRRYGKCDGSIVGSCDCTYPGCKVNVTQAIMLSTAFEVLEDASTTPPQTRAPGLVCDNVPQYGESWWAGFMSYPTFTAFVAPYTDWVDIGDGQALAPLNRTESSTWLDTFAHICDFDNWTEAGSFAIHGAVCQKTYFHASQEVISTMVMSGHLNPLPEPGCKMQAKLKALAAAKARADAAAARGEAEEKTSANIIKKSEVSRWRLPASMPRDVAVGGLAAAVVAVASLLALLAIARLEVGGPRYRRGSAASLVPTSDTDGGCLLGSMHA